MSLKHSIFYPVLEPETELLSPHLLSTLLFWLRDWYSPPPTFLHHHSYHPWVVSPVSGGLRLLPRIHSCFPFCLFSIEWSQFCELQICSASPPQNLSAFSVLFSSPLFVWPSLNNSAGYLPAFFLLQPSQPRLVLLPMVLFQLQRNALSAILL